MLYQKFVPYNQIIINIISIRLTFIRYIKNLVGYKIIINNLNKLYFEFWSVTL